MDLELELELVNTVFFRPPYITLRNLVDSLLVSLTNQFINERPFVGTMGMTCFLLTCLYLSLNGKPFSDFVLSHLLLSKTLVNFLKVQYLEFSEVFFYFYEL